MRIISQHAAAFVAQAISPFNDVAAVTTPTLIVCGEKDWNVPVSQVDLRFARDGRCHHHAPVTNVVVIALSSLR